MRVYLKNRSGSYEATGEYNEITKELVVLKGSRVSSTIASGSFRSAKSVAKYRNDVCDEAGNVVKNILFKSPSIAANFVTGSSTNGMLAWKNEIGSSLKEI